MKIDLAGLNSLLIFPKVLKNYKKTSSDMTLLHILDNTKTSIGSRLLKKWIK